MPSLSIIVAAGGRPFSAVPALGQGGGWAVRCPPRSFPAPSLPVARVGHACVDRLRHARLPSRSTSATSHSRDFDDAPPAPTVERSSEAGQPQCSAPAGLTAETDRRTATAPRSALVCASALLGGAAAARAEQLPRSVGGRGVWDGGWVYGVGWVADWHGGAEAPPGLGGRAACLGRDGAG
jgi:hypothetical protein